MVLPMKTARSTFTRPRHPRSARASCALLLAALLCVGFSASAKSGGDPEVPGEVLVRLRATADLQPLLLKYSLALRAQFGARPIYRLSVVGAAATHDVIGALALEPAVLNAEANAIHSAPEARRNTAWAIGTPAAYTAQWAPTALRLEQAHALTRGAGVRVAVLDTGIDAAHPAFAGRLLQGYDFVDGKLDPSEVVVPGSFSYGHGTHVAGLVALAAPQAQIMPLRVLDAQGQGNAWVLAEAMLYAVDPDRNPATDDGAQVINMSLGSTNRTQLFDAIAQLSACSIPAPTDPKNTFTDPGYNADRQRCDAFGGAVVIAAESVRPVAGNGKQRAAPTRNLRQLRFLGRYRGPRRRHHQRDGRRRLGHLERHVDGRALGRRRRCTVEVQRAGLERQRHRAPARTQERRTLRHQRTAPARRRSCAAQCGAARRTLPLKQQHNRAE
jgi:hypothetical protein